MDRQEQKVPEPDYLDILMSPDIPIKELVQRAERGEFRGLNTERNLPHRTQEINVKLITANGHDIVTVTPQEARGTVENFLSAAGCLPVGIEFKGNLYRADVGTFKREGDNITRQ